MKKQTIESYHPMPSMKSIIAALLAFASINCLFAQGTLSFSAVLSGANALPPNNARYDGNGRFVLEENSLFSGSVWVRIGWVGSVRIYGSSEPGVLGTPLFDFTPGPGYGSDGYGGDPGGRRYDISRNLSDAERSNLLAGNWWAVYFQDDFPGGASRGQIMAIPEPPAWAMFVIGLGFLSVFARSNLTMKFNLKRFRGRAAWSGRHRDHRQTSTETLGCGSGALHERSRRRLPID